MQRPSLGTQGSGRIPLSSQKSIPRSNAIPIGNNISASPNISTRGRRNSQDNAYESSRLSEGRHSRTNSIDYSSNMNIITGQSRTPPTNTPPYPFTNRLSNRQSVSFLVLLYLAFFFITITIARYYDKWLSSRQLWIFSV